MRNLKGQPVIQVDNFVLLVGDSQAGAETKRTVSVADLTATQRLLEPR
jgi:hypothetical protein